MQLCFSIGRVLRHREHGYNLCTLFLTFVKQASTVNISAYQISIREEASIDVSSAGSDSGPGKGSDINGASYGGSGGRDVDDYFSYAYDVAQIVGNPLNE